MNIKVLKSGLLALVVSMLYSNFSYGQFRRPREEVNCSRFLNEAEDEFDAGRLSGIPKLLNQEQGLCFHGDGFSKEELIQAYRLMALVHIFKDQEIEAEEAVIHLLKVDPEHVKSPNDPQELIYLIEKYRTDPIFRIGFKIGVNQTFVTEKTEYGSYNLGSQSKSYTAKLGLNMEVTFEYNVARNLDLLTGLQWANQAYEVKYDVLNPSDVLTRSADYLTTIKESQSSLKVPLMLRYRLPLTKLAPYVLVGASADYLLSAKMTGERSGTAVVPLTGLKLNDFALREKYNFSYFGGLGIKLRVNKVHYMTFEARYSMAGANTVKTDNRYESDKLDFDLNHVDSNKKLNAVSFSVGYIHSFYKPKKHTAKKLEKIKKDKVKQSLK